MARGGGSGHGAVAELAAARTARLERSRQRAEQLAAAGGAAAPGQVRAGSEAGGNLSAPREEERRRQLPPVCLLDSSSDEEGDVVAMPDENQGRAGVPSAGSRDDPLSSITNRMGTLGLRPSLAPVATIKPAVPARRAEAPAASASTGDAGELTLPTPVAKLLYAHQREGVAWLWGLHRMGRGGILADDMGLGKTMQVSAFLAGLFDMRRIRRAMVVAPKTLLEHWAKELRTCGLASKTHQYYAGTPRERQSALTSVMRHPGVLLTTYGMVQHNSAALAEARQVWLGEEEEEEDEDRPLWDLMILDEGHKVKNPKMQLVQHLNSIPVAMRVIISGTPIQNNLMEFHSLLDFACPGLLDDRQTFKRCFEVPITIGSDKSATHRERSAGAATAARLRATTAPYILRREKKEVLPDRDNLSEAPGAKDDSGLQTSAAPKPQGMGRKNDFIVWLRLAPMQRRIYEAFLNSEAVKAALNQTGSALAAITVLKKVCDHPALLSDQAARLVMRGGSRLAAGGPRRSYDSDSDADSGADSEDFISCSSGDEADAQGPRAGGSRGRGGPQDPGAAGEDWWTWAGDDIQGQLLSSLAERAADASCKTVFVMSLVRRLCDDGHRTLIFSQSRVMLDIIQAELRECGVRFLRIDGTVSSAKERQALVASFQAPGSRAQVFLLTSQVGGLGLTLTAADRVIIVDPAWNPSTDNQAVDRAYRIGQAKDVVVYRLITCGTVEEKIYRNQVHKAGLSRAGMEDGNHFRYFSHQDLRDLFSTDPAELAASRTQAQLHELHAAQRVAGPELTAHLTWLESLPAFAGVSDHDLIYSKACRPPTCIRVPAGPSAPCASAKTDVAASLTEAMDGFAHSSRDAHPVAARAPAGGRAGGRGKSRREAAPSWSGAGALSDMFESALKLGLPAEESAEQRAQAEVDRLEKELSGQRALAERLQRMGSKLPDGGLKVKQTVQTLEVQLSEASAKLSASRSASETSGGAAPERGASPEVSSRPPSAAQEPAPKPEAAPRPAAAAATAGDLAAKEAAHRRAAADIATARKQLFSYDDMIKGKAALPEGADMLMVKRRAAELHQRYGAMKAKHVGQMKALLLEYHAALKGGLPAGRDAQEVKTAVRALETEYQAAKRAQQGKAGGSK
eukprot:jgi/Tetstr1/463143/TSEL_008077.t1